MTEESVIIDFVKTAAREKRESLDEAVTEDAAAMAFAERYGARLRFDHDVGKWFVWSGHHWQGETTDLAFSYTRELARELAKGQAHKVRLASSKTGFAAGVERFARSDRAFAVTSTIWDRNTYAYTLVKLSLDKRLLLCDIPAAERLNILEGLDIAGSDQHWLTSDMIAAIKPMDDKGYEIASEALKLGDGKFLDVFAERFDTFSVLNPSLISALQIMPGFRTPGPLISEYV